MDLCYVDVVNKAITATEATTAPRPGETIIAPDHLLDQNVFFN